MREEKLKQLKEYIELLGAKKRELVESNSGFLSIEKYDITLGNGDIIRREKILKNKLDGSAVIMLPITEDGEYLVAVEPRVFTKLGSDAGFPAGYIDKGEDKTLAVRRELLEETGYEVKEVYHMGSFYQDQGCSGALNEYFIGVGAKKVGEQALDEGEYVKYMTFSREEVGELIDLGYMGGLNNAYIYEKSKSFVKEKGI